MSTSDARSLRVAVNAYFCRHPLTQTGSGQYLIALLAALRAGVPRCQFQLYQPDERGGAVSTDGGRTPAAGTGNASPGPLAKLRFEQLSFPRAAYGHADLLHYPYWAAPLSSALPTVVTVHDLIPLLLAPYRGPLLARAYTALVAAATRRATMIATDSAASKRDIVARLGVPPDRVRVVHLAAGDAFRPLDDAARLAEVRARHDLSGPFVFYVGGLDRRKNVDRLIRAFARARPHLPAAAVLAIAGDAERRGPLFPDLPAVARACGIEGIVRFIGRVPDADLPALYSAASAVAFPTLYEGFGLPALEALSSAVPLLCSSAASLPEVVGNAALLLDPLDEEAWAAALARVLTDDALRDELRRQGPLQAARFSWQKAAAETAAVYDEALARWAMKRG